MTVKDISQYTSVNGEGSYVYCMRSAGGLGFAKAIAYELCCKELAETETTDKE